MLKAPSRTQGACGAIQVGGCGIWRIDVIDLEDYTAGAYRCTEERIASGEIVDDAESDAD
ncbi:hypothetical protein [Pseudarthrobacter sp. B4EP4b]|uniref:hypothetical protein n=1 Tax=Pseudarthrobacter sp. B4EP4b TaxID=2590664 RepID=UPI00114D82DA|nr:hypothetical protein [Pseudarthrobacter sp. B4EP4b]